MPSASWRSSATSGTTSWRPRPETTTFASARSPTRPIGQFRFRQKLELLKRGFDDDSPACRGSALVSLELLSRDHPGAVNAIRPDLHMLASRDDNGAVRRMAIMCLRNGSPQSDTLGLLAGMADDESQDESLRAAARTVVASLKRKATTRSRPGR